MKLLSRCAVVTFILGVAAFGLGGLVAGEKKVKVGDKAPALKGVDENGKDIDTLFNQIGPFSGDQGFGFERGGRRLLEALQKQADQDAVTGLFNRGYLDRRIAHDCQEAQRSPLPPQPLRALREPQPYREREPHQP